MGFDVEEYSKQRKKQQTTNAGNGGFDVEAYSKSRYAPQAGEEILSRVNTWLKKNESFINSYNTRYGENTSSYRADSADWLSSVTSQSSDLEKEANEIKSLLQQYQDFFSSDFVGSINSAINPSLSLQNKILSNSTKDHEYWSQWENEDAYKRDMADWLEDNAEVNAEKVAARQELYQSNAARIKELEDKYEGTGWRLLDDLLHGFFRNTEEEEGEYYEGMDELDRLRAENTRYEREQRELDNYFVPETEEFLQNAAYREYSNPTKQDVEAYAIANGDTDVLIAAGYYPYDGAWRDNDGNAIEIDYDVEKPVVEDKLAFYLDNLNSEDHVISNTATDFMMQYMSEGYNGKWEFLKENEINTYYDLYKREGQQAAYDFLDAMKVTLNKRSTDKMAKDVSEAPVLEQIFYNVASVPANIFGGAVAFVDDTINILQGEDINPYSAAHGMQNFAQAVREDTANDIVKATGGASLPYVGTTWGDAYQALMSGVDSLVGSALGGTAYGILMGMGAASSEAKELYEKGASLDQIAAGGIFAGAAEMVFEKFSIDKFVKMGDTKTLKTLVINTLKQGGVEASEEMLTEIANTITDAAVMGSQSDLQGYVDQYIAQGYSESEAVVKALFNDVAANVLNAGISGFLSGGGMGSLGSIGSYANYQSQVKSHGQSIINEGGVDTLKALALDMAGVKDSTNAKSIGKLASKVDSKASAKNVGRLSAAIGDTVSVQNKSDVQSALTEKGLSKKDAARVAEYLTSNEVLSEEQKAEIEGNEKVAEVVKELVKNKNSVVNQRKLNLLAARLGVDIKNSTINGKSTSVNGVSLKNEVDVTGKVSEEGKTTKVSTGEVITIDKNNAIAKTKIVDGERVVYYNTDHGVVEATDVSYASKEDGLLFESFSDMNPAFANAAIKNYDGSVPVQTYIDGMREGMILYGMHNFQAVGKDISRNSDFAELSEADQAFALKLGRAYANANVKKSDNAMKAAIKNAAEKAGAEGDTSAVRKKVSVRLENGAKATTKAQRKAVALAKHLSKAIGIDIVFYDARYTTDKHGKGANGYFDSKTNSIRLDLQKAATDTKTIAFTLSHEMVHFIKKWSPAKFKTFADFLMEQYAAHGVSTSTLLANKMAQLGETNADKAYEEMICDACERMLLDSNAVMKLMELRKSDLELFEKIKLHILEILNNIRDAFKGVDPNTDEGKALQKMEDVLGKIHEMFEDAAVDAVQNYQAHKALNTEYVSVSEDGTIQMQMKQYEQTGRSTLLTYLKEQYGDNNANDLIATIDSIYNVMAEIKKDTALSVFGNWQDTEVELDANGHPIFTTSINNGDYELNQDFSRVCKKRRQLNFVLNMLAEDPAFEASNLTKDDFVKINKAIKEHGFEIACALCFVDSKRFRQTEWADSFANTWNDILGSMKADSKPLSRFNFATKSVNMADEGIQIDPSKPISYRKWSNGKATETRHYENLDDLLARDGNNNVKAIARLLRDNPNLRHEFRGADIIASDGFDSIQRLAPDVRGILDGWGGSSVPKPSSNDAIYDNSILNIDGYNAEKAFAVGGVRMNSFSDFMAHMFFDYAQAFADLSAKKLPMHSYTKELDFARLFGLTGGKINMSAIAAIRKGAANIDKIKAKADKEAATDYEKSIAGLDISRLAEKLGKSESDVTYDDVIQNLDDVDYVWADESIDVKSATLLQSGILYDKLTEGQAAYCYELIRNGQIEEAFRIAGEENVNRGYAKHLGIITVGVSKAHILKLLRDPTIRMVIPYHKSGLNPAVAKALNIAFYDDFTDVQNTIVRFKGGDQFGISSDSSKIGGKKLQDFAFYDFFGKTIDGVLYDGKATAAKYIEWCEKGFYDESVGDYVYYLNGGGYILASELHAKGIEVKPKFYEFASEENYYKLVEDFDCYDTITGEHSAQEAVDLFHDGLPSDYKDVLTKALKAEQKVSDDFRDHLDNKGLRDEIMAIAGKHGYTPSNLNETWGDIVETVGEDNIGEATELLTDVENTTSVKKQKKNTSDNTYENIGKELLYYEEGDLAPDLTLVETLNDRTGNKEVTIKHYGQKPKGYIPKKIAYCYKLFEQHPDGTLHALFAGAKNAVPIGEWRYAQGFPRTDDGVSGMNLRERYGWHLSAGLPSAPHLMSSKSFERGYPSKGAYGHKKGSKRVWVRMAYDASTDFNSIADSTGKQNDIYGLIPFGGYYAFKENNQSEWVISSAVKIDKILTEEERQQILKDAGYDEYEAWRLKYQPTPEEKAARELANKERAKAKARAKKLGIDSELSASTKAMRDSIKSRIVDNPELNDGVKKQVKKTSYAPTFYSQMGKVIDDIKMEKIGAASVLNYIKGKGIKNEEIKWSGIEAFLEGKKSVTKKELQEFVAGSMLQIEEQVSDPIPKLEIRKAEDDEYAFVLYDENGNVVDRYYYDYAGELVSENTDEAYLDVDTIKEELEQYAGETKWSQYKLDGGSNYRELVFVMPNSSYNNRAMRAHWGQDAEGVLAHARIQDFVVNGKKMLFIEELQSDWHNEGLAKGYTTEEYEEAVATYDDLYNKYQKHDLALSKYIRSNEFMTDPEDVRKKKFDWLRGKVDAAQKKYIEANKVVKSLKEKGAGDTPDAPFRNTYHEYVLKRLLRMAAEEGYDSIGWTPSEIQSDRWSDEFAEAYRIEYDQDMPKFLRKYGKRWGVTVGSDTVNGDTEIWSMDITDSMKESVLYEGQPMFQKKQTTNRELLANALESVAQNDIEKNKLAQYKSKIDLIESEQAKLAEVKAEANALRFTKGRTPEETKRMKSLDFEANQIANRINTYDRQLLNLESTEALKNVLQREKELVRKKTEQKGKEALRKAKEKRDETIRTIMTKNREARERGIESRSKTELRGKIKSIVSDLNTLLLDPTKDKHVPIGLQKPVAAALDIINMDTVGAEERIAKYDALIAKANDPDVIESLKKSRDRIALQGETLSDRLAALKAAYAEIKNSDDPLVKNSHNEAIESLIDSTIDKVGNTSLRDMSLEQLETVYDMFKAIKATVRNANKMFKEGRQETVTENSEAVKAEVREAGGHRERILKATKWLKKFGWDMLKPLQALRVIGSNTFSKLFENVRKGEDTWAVDVNEAKKFFVVKSMQYGYDSWDFKKRYTFKDSAGNTFSLSLEQIMSLYAYSKRDKADRHLEVGGFIFDDAIEVTEKGKFGIPMKYEVNDANPYRLRREDLGAVISSLTSEQRSFVDEMQAYLSDVMGEKGNEISLAMYDIKLYTEKHYFPLKTAKYFREFDPEKNGMPKIKNSGFSKKTLPNAGNPIVLSNFMDVWGNHVNDMSMYHAFVLPLEDFMRVYNYSSTAGGYDSVQQYIKNAYGAQANQYIERLMDDLNGGARVDPSAGIINKGIGLFKKASVFASASVVIQQPSAIARALAYVNAKYFIDKPELTKHSETWAEVKKYAPVAIIKEMGYFDTNMGRSTVDWIKDKKTFMDKIDDFASKAPALADELAWCGIWKAVKREIADTTNLKVGSEEFLKRAGERFTEVVTNTQVYDSVLSRSGMMRSKDTGMKMATAFMAEPTTALNMVVDAFIQGKRGNKKFAASSIGAVSASVILNSILVALVYAARDDDDDETYTEKYLASLTTELIDGFNPLTYIPFVKDVWSIAQGFDVERSDMSVVSTLWESIENLFSDNKSGWEKTEGVVGSIASVFGLPAKNVMRDARAMYNLAENLLSDTPTTKAGVADAVSEAAKSSIPLWSRIERWAGAADSKSDKLYDAIISGDQAHIERIKSGYKDEQAINTAIRTGLRENDSRIKEAAQARIDGDISEYTRLVREIVAEGNFVQDLVVGAINAEINAINKKADDQNEASDEEDEAEKATSIYKGSDINDAFDSGDTDLALEIIDDLVKVKTENNLAKAKKEAEDDGKTFNERKAREEAEKNAKSSVKSSITSYWKPLYKAAYKAGDTEEMKRIRLILKESGLYGRTNDILDTCKAWLRED